MKVLQVTERFPPAPGGVETHVFHLSIELRKLGVEVNVLTTDLFTVDPLQRLSFRPLERSQAEKDSTKRVSAIPFLPLPQGLGLIFPSVAFQLKNYDLVHAHGYGHFPTYLAPLCRIMKIPIVITTHSDAGVPSIRKRIFDLLVPKLTIENATKIIALSKHEKAVLIERGIRAEAISIIPNGITLSEFLENRSDQARKIEPSRTILYVGRIDFAQKGVDLLLMAFGMMCREGSTNATLRLVGIGPQKNMKKLATLAKGLDVSEKVTFLGYLPRKEYLKELKNANLLVLPSRFEPFGIVLLEAMACGVPVVASKVGGVPELIIDGRNGLLFEPRNVASLQSKMGQILSNPALATDLSRNGFDSLEKYSWTDVAKETLQVYLEAIRMNSA